MEAFKAETLTDFTFAKGDLDKELLVYNFDEMIEFIERSTDASVVVCSSINNKV
ncbi:hypothetical protein [Scopulibacillus darangshiensis]|uniref:hypothetical protein n=1 Tax=Scopulibacillus darangshiensis TaxID=442528 RepID=UPI001404A04B|nr:hypothetical protein [Scopulibacillus darangshiensis]